MAEGVTRHDRELLLGQRGVVAWFTGLSGSGKTTLTADVERVLHDDGILVRRLDGDDVRRGLNAGLGFDMEARRENIRRIAEAARLFLDSGVVVLVAVISPTVEIREMARDIVGADDFIEIFVNCPLDVCERRDVKGMYRAARGGSVAQFTGVAQPYEAPPAPDLEIRTDRLDLTESTALVLDAVLARVRDGAPAGR